MSLIKQEIFQRVKCYLLSKLAGFTGFFVKLFLCCFYEMYFSIRAWGSAALNMCAVAAGYADAYYEFGPHCWDFAAGEVIVKEAGGTVVDTEGK